MQRDYSKGMKLRFDTNLPKNLENYLSQDEFFLFIENLNEIYLDAEKLRLCEGCIACLTAYLLYCCIETHKQKCMKRASELIVSQNDVWKDRGITVFDPMSKGFRILEIQVHGGNQGSTNQESVE